MFKKKIYIAAGYNTIYMGSGRPEFDPQKKMRSFEEYLLETAEGTVKQIEKRVIDEGIIGSFMSPRFLKQANLAGFLPFMLPILKSKPCVAVEGACGTGGKAIALAMRSILSDLADVVFVTAFEIQNVMKAVYGADVLAGAAYFNKMRKKGDAFFFPGLFSIRAEEYKKQYGAEKTRRAFAKWYEQAILNARKNSKAQEYYNTLQDPFSTSLENTKNLNPYDCSKVSDGASSLLVLSEEGLLKTGLKKEDAIEIVSIGEAEGNITEDPKDLVVFEEMQIAVQKTLSNAGICHEDIGLLELHDCFTISALLSLEAARFVGRGEAADFILSGSTSKTGILPTNLSGGLIGFGHPTGASGVRQMVDLLHQLTGRAENQHQIRKQFGMMISMGGNDKTLTSILVKRG